MLGSKFCEIFTWHNNDSCIILKFPVDNNPSFKLKSCIAVPKANYAWDPQCVVIHCWNKSLYFILINKFLIFINLLNSSTEHPSQLRTFLARLIEAHIKTSYKCHLSQQYMQMCQLKYTTSPCNSYPHKNSLYAYQLVDTNQSNERSFSHFKMALLLFISLIFMLLC